MARRSKFGRFQVWNQPSDSWKHTDEAYNLDTLDQMIGGPSQTPTKGIGDDFNSPTTTAPTGSGQWLHPQDTTQITNFGNRTLYNIVQALDHNDVPLGAVFAWWRPSSDVPLPYGCVPADGSIYTGATQHSYVPYGLTSITVPDMRNKMILGANIANVDGAAGTTPSVQAASGAPGIRGTGGTNVPRVLTHTHTAGAYIHSHQHTIYHTHTVTAIDHQHATGGPIGGFQFRTAASGGYGIYSDGISQNNSTPVHTHQTGFINAYGIYGPTVTTSDVSSAWSSGPDSTAITGTSGPASAGLTGVEILPQYIGLLWMVKIRKDGPLHNTAFTAGP